MNTRGCPSLRLHERTLALPGSDVLQTGAESIRRTWYKKHITRDLEVGSD